MTAPRGESLSSLDSRRMATARSLPSARCSILPDALGAESGPLATSRGDCSGLEPLAGAKNHPFAVVEATQRSDLLDLAVIEQFLLGVWELCTGTSGAASA